MEGKDQNKLTVEDILDQLVRPSVLEVSGSKSFLQRPLQTGASSFGDVKTATAPQGVGLNLPSLKTAPTVSAAAQPSQSPAKSELPAQLSELRLSIRTMADDLEKLKRGQKPEGLAVQKIFKSVDLSSSVPLPAPVAPISTMLKPSPPSPDVSKITLPPLSQTPKQSSSSSSPAPLFPSFYPSLESKKPGSAEPTEEKIEYKIIAKVIGSGMTTGVLTTLAIAAIIYSLFYFFVLNKEELEIVVPTPLPSRIASPSPLENNELEEIFGKSSQIIFLFPDSGQSAISKFKTFTDVELINEGEFKRISFSIPGQIKKPALTDIFGKFYIGFPTELKSRLKDNYLALLYGQQEQFNSGGEVETGDSAGKRLIFVAEVDDVAKTLEIMKIWELIMQSNLEEIFELDIAKQASRDFLDNNRGNTKVRYKNFPFPDKSIDYALVSSLTGRNYLVIANSRESMFFPADKIRGL